MNGRTTTRQERETPRDFRPGAFGTRWKVILVREPEIQPSNSDHRSSLRMFSISSWRPEVTTGSPLRST